jgi:hypothetical protein
MIALILVKMAISIILITGLLCGIGMYFEVNYEKVLRPIAGIGMLILFLLILILVWIAWI